MAALNVKGRSKRYRSVTPLAIANHPVTTTTIDGATTVIFKKTASIPSKFEAKPPKFAGESDGFMSRTSRFAEFAADDIPGPGRYRVAQHMSLDETSLSKRGYGNFASKGKRWFDAPGPNFNPPGPGQYDAPSFADTSSKNFNRLTSSMFAPSVKPIATHNTSQSVSAPSTNRQAVPGPGEYNSVDIDKVYEYEHKPQGSFLSNASRFQSTGKRPTPGPGQYNPPIEITVHSQKHENLPSAVFRSRTERTEQSSKKQLVVPVHGMLYEEAAKYLEKADSTIKPKPSLRRPRSNSPTLSYSPTTKNTLHGHIPSILHIHTIERPKKLSSVFIEGSYDRFGRKKTKDATDATPGPGSYDVVKPLGSDKSSSAVFKLAGEKPKEVVTKYKPPGPAFYNPEKIRGKSFHLNVARTWM